MISVAPGHPERRAGLVLAASAVGVLLLAVAFASIGNPAPTIATLSAVIDTAVRAGAPAALYVLGAIGLGRVLRPSLAGAEDAMALQAGLGLALMLTLSHGLGCLGLLSGTMGQGIATAVVLAGLALGVNQLVRWRRSAAYTRIAVSSLALLGIPPVALLVVAACQPPGWLWASEFGGYDVLSYHLQLPREWLELGRIAPLEHNVYTYLPGYVEAAFLHLGVLMGAKPAGSDGGLGGFVGGAGMPLLACQFLHASFAMLSAWMVARCVGAALRRSGLGHDRQGAATAFAGVLFLSTAWIVVVGSMAYNEMGMTALGAAAMLAAMETGIAPARRGALTGLLVGVACGCKGTALLFFGLPAGVLLLGLAPAGAWWRLVATGSVAGVAALSPWLIRNGVTGGNPVFPYLASVFGTAHWNHEQVERFRAATIVDESIPRRIALLVMPDEHDPAGVRHRGLLHPQWGILFPVCLLSGIAATVTPRTRRIALLLGAGLALQLVAWLFVSHLQSRFLIPLAVPACVLAGLAAARATDQTPRAGVLVMIAIAAAQCGWAAWIFSAQGMRKSERAGGPNWFLVPGPGVLTGALFDSVTEAENMGAASPEVVHNLSSPATRRGALLLLGDATPLYFAGSVVYATTWDRSVLADAMRDYPDEPEAWTATLRDREIARVLVNFSELNRLRRSGYLDPALTPEAIARWLEASARPLREWAGGARVLFDLGETASGTTGGQP